MKKRKLSAKQSDDVLITVALYLLTPELEQQTRYIERSRHLVFRVLRDLPELAQTEQKEWDFCQEIAENIRNFRSLEKRAQTNRIDTDETIELMLTSGRESIMKILGEDFAAYC